MEVIDGRDRCSSKNMYNLKNKSFAIDYLTSKQDWGMNNFEHSNFRKSKDKISQISKFLCPCIILLLSLVGQLYIKSNIDKMYIFNYKNNKNLEIIKGMNNFADNCKCIEKLLI